MPGPILGQYRGQWCPRTDVAGLGDTIGYWSLRTDLILAVPYHHPPKSLLRAPFPGIPLSIKPPFFCLLTLSIPEEGRWLAWGGLGSWSHVATAPLLMSPQAYL